MSSDDKTSPTEDQLRQADSNGVLRWKELEDIKHIKTAVRDGCPCGLCETVRSLINSKTANKSSDAFASVIRRLNFLRKMR